MKEILEENSDLRYVIKEFPILGEKSLMLSRVSIVILIEEGPEMYKKFSDVIMTYNGPVNISMLQQLAKSVGSNVKNLDSLINLQNVNQQILLTNRLAEKLKIQGTPTFIIGNQMIRGYIPKIQLQEIIDKVKKNL